MASHRYWRIRSLMNLGSQTGVTGLEMATSPGGTNLATVGANGIVSGTYGGGLAASAAFDNRTDTNWFTPDNGNTGVAWIGYDFGSGNDQAIEEVRIMHAFQDTSGTPRWFVVESSDDNVTWSYEWTGIYGPWVLNVFVAFPRPQVQAENTWWGIICLSSENGSNDTVIAELECRVGATGVDETAGGIPYACFESSSFPISGLIDDDVSHVVYAGATGKFPIYYVELPGAAKAITHLAITADVSSGSHNEKRAPMTGRAMYSQTGTSWIFCNEGDWSVGTYTSGEQKIIHVQAAARRRAAVVVC